MLAQHFHSDASLCCAIISLSVLHYGTSLDIRFSPTKYCLFKIGKDFSKNVPAVCIDGQNICLVEHSYIFKYVQCVQKNIHYCFLAYSEKKEPI